MAIPKRQGRSETIIATPKYIYIGDYIAVVQKEDCKGRNVLAPLQREPGGRAYKEKAYVGQLVYNCLYIYGEWIVQPSQAAGRLHAS